MVGIVDGLSEELHCAGDDPSQWKHRRNIVVEVRVTEGGTTDWRLLFVRTFDLALNNEFDSMIYLPHLFSLILNKAEAPYERSQNRTTVPAMHSI